jgi:hypothetical protein
MGLLSSTYLAHISHIAFLNLLSKYKKLSLKYCIWLLTRIILSPHPDAEITIKPNVNAVLIVSLLSCW